VDDQNLSPILEGFVEFASFYLVPVQQAQEIEKAGLCDPLILEAESGEDERLSKSAWSAIVHPSLCMTVHRKTLQTLPAYALWFSHQSFDFPALTAVFALRKQVLMISLLHPDSLGIFRVMPMNDCQF
jgi:hypothetical protein